MDDDHARRGALVAAAVDLDDRGLNVNSSGNLSVRSGGGCIVTPTGIPAVRLTAADLVSLDADGAPTMAGQRSPTSEWRLHCTIYARRPDVGAIVHTHSPEATAAAIVGIPIPPLHYVVARFGGHDLACAPYATYGTDELAAAVADTLGAARRACLMANHGAIAVAADLDTALALALDVEWFCGVVRRAHGFAGVPQHLSYPEVDRVAELFGSYGQPAAD